LNPDLGEAHHQLGFVYLHIGLLDKGWQELQKALAINPGNSLARYRLGVIDMCRGKYEEAFQIFNTTPLEMSPSLLASYTSTALFRLGREAEEAIQHAVEIGRGYAHFHHTSYNIASAYALMNQPEPAMKWLLVTADEGFPCYPLFERDTNLDNLRKGAVCFVHGATEAAVGAFQRHVVTRSECPFCIRSHYPLPFFNCCFHPSTRALFPSASASGTIPFF
jgi:tetratricopeptide (TPR) repeat protein